MGFGIAMETSIWLFLCFHRELSSSIRLCSLTGQLPQMLAATTFPTVTNCVPLQLGAKINPHLLKLLLSLLFLFIVVRKTINTAP